MRVYYPTDQYCTRGVPRVFLAGTIDMGASRDWQQEMIDALAESGRDCDVLNPRRAEWDSSWQQDSSCKDFVHQVEWELAAIEDCDIVAFHLEPTSQSPISLLELGIVSQNDPRALMSCPEGFYRRGNVEIVCNRYGIPLLNGVEELAQEVVRSLDALAHIRPLNIV